MKILTLEVKPDLPFFVERTRNHMIPVFLHFEAVRDQRKITIIKHIDGDIWVSFGGANAYLDQPWSIPLLTLQELERQLKAHLEADGKKITSQVNEVAMYIKFKGDYVLKVRNWFASAGF